MQNKIVKFVFILLFLFAVSSVWAFTSTQIRSMNEVFDSAPMLEKFYKEPNHASHSWDKVKISLLTMSKEDAVYSWFGHSAILVEYEDSPAVLYDYGRFSFGPDFYVNFAKGRLWYKCSWVFAVSELQIANAARRTVSKVELNLTAKQKEAVVVFLNINSSDEYNTYLYHHYLDNCATRLRDIINVATDGDFERWAKEQKGMTFRQETSRILHNNLPVQWTLDFLQSGNIDGENTRWDEMFLPSELEKALLDYNGKIVGPFSYEYDNRVEDTRPLDYERPQTYWLESLIFGIAIALIAVFLRKRSAGWYSFWTFFILFVLGLLGSLLFFMSAFTSHDVTWNNINLLFINPFVLVAAFLSIRSWKHQTVLKPFFRILLFFIAVTLIGKLILPQFFIQSNLPQILTVLPLYLVLAF